MGRPEVRSPTVILSPNTCISRRFWPLMEAITFLFVAVLLLAGIYLTLLVRRDLQAPGQRAAHGRSRAGSRAPRGR